MNKQDYAGYLKPDWPAPAGISCLVSTRQSGRENLQKTLGENKPLHWVKQVHGKDVVKVSSISSLNSELKEADALYTDLPNKACGILTADCLPVFFCDLSGKEIAVAHAGWRGLAAGVVENTLSCFKAKPEEIMAWLGPAIGPCHFEVGGEVKEEFINTSNESLKEEVLSAFSPGENSQKWMADLFKLARIRLTSAGINQIYGGDVCTYCNDDTFYSYRKDNMTGRFASVIWKD